MKIYTRTGDKGKTSLFDGSRVLKSSDRVETYGTIDELNSFIGVAIVDLKNQQSEENNVVQRSKIFEELERIQHDLLSVGSTLATPAGMPVIGLEKRPEDFEKLIDEMTIQMPELRNFILPGGVRAAASLHVCRVIARRAERRVIGLMQRPASVTGSGGEKEEVDEIVVKYLNRLSDLFFTMARYANFLERKSDILWKQK